MTSAYSRHLQMTCSNDRLLLDAHLQSRTYIFRQHHYQTVAHSYNRYVCLEMKTLIIKCDFQQHRQKSIINCVICCILLYVTMHVIYSLPKKPVESFFFFPANNCSANNWCSHPQELIRKSHRNLKWKQLLTHKFFIRIAIQFKI